MHEGETLCASGWFLGKKAQKDTATENRQESGSEREMQIVIASSCTGLEIAVLLFGYTCFVYHYASSHSITDMFLTDAAALGCFS